MGQDTALYCYVVSQALTGEPGQIDGSVYADRFEGSAGVAGGWEFGLI